MLDKTVLLGYNTNNEQMFGRLKIMIIATFFEILFAVALIWGIFYEDSLIAFEKAVAANIRRRRLRVFKPSCNNTVKLHLRVER